MSCVAECRQYLNHRILNRPFEGHETERASLLTMMQRTLNFGESNSVLIIGTSGTGKTMMVESVIDEIENTKAYSDRCCIVQLHGRFHTDDKIAFDDICRQLKIKYEINESSQFSSDTLTKMLQDCSTDDENFKSVIFVLEDFHYFCDRASQDLLYVLFDTAQAKKVPIFIVGVTTQVKVVELLEKRVKSRFSGNCIRLSSPRNFKETVSKFTKFLTLKEDACSNSSFVERWNKNMKKLLSDAAVINVFKELSIASVSERLFTNFMFYSVSQISEKNPNLTKNILQNTMEMLRPETKVELLKSLSTLELCLVIACYHQTNLYDGEPFNFEMIYQRYHKFTQGALAVPNVPRQMAYQQFENLIELQLIAPFNSDNSESEPREYIFHKLLVPNVDIEEAVRTYPNLLDDIRQWAEDSLS